MRRFLWFTLATAVLVAICAGPTHVSKERAATTRTWLTAAPASINWMQPRDQASEWLDEPAAAFERLGGTYLVLKVDAESLRTTMLTKLRDDVRGLMRSARIPYGGLAVRDGSVELRVRQTSDLPRALSTLAATFGPLPQSPEGGVDVHGIGEDAIRLTLTEAAFSDQLRVSRDRSIAIIKQYTRELGIANAGVERDGRDRIRVLLPGLRDIPRSSM